MRCWLFIYALSMAILNYVLGIPEELDQMLTAEEHGYKLTDEYSSGDHGRDPVLLAGETNDTKKRSLVAGDTFTPQEMLPIAVKLLKKVEEPGNGKGFVSSTKLPKELADKLFEAFFIHTSNRIVTLKDEDIIGIDALQALALEGEDADDTLTGDEVTEAAQKMYLRGQMVDIEKHKPLKSHYKLVTKVIPTGIKNKRKKDKRRGIPLSKKLPPKRHLVVNKRSQKRQRIQKINKKYNVNLTRVSKNNKHLRNRSTNVKKNRKLGAKKSNCRWKYVCTTAGDLDSCRLQTLCGYSSSVVTPVQKKKDDNDKLLQQFRRMVGITAVDEEVEKIFEARNIKTRPVNLQAIEKVESLAEFFNNILVNENMEATTPIAEKTFHMVSSKLDPETDHLTDN